MGKMFKNLLPLKLLSQFEDQTYVGMVLGWSPFRNLSDDHAPANQD